MSAWHLIELMWGEYGIILLAVLAGIVIQQRRLNRTEKRLMARLDGIDHSGIEGKIASYQTEMKARFATIHAEMEAELDRRWPNRLRH
jgi:hypothetical protein